MTTNMEYQKSINILTSQAKFHINLGLERMKKILNLLNNPQDKLKFIHVAGSNGKGSVCAILAEILKQSNFKCGLYTSPHLLRYNERIKINNVAINDNDFAMLVQKICTIANQNGIDLTEFEILTVIAFEYFKLKDVDIVILETGLGGRLDATNVITKNICSVITSLSLEHTDRLGNSIEAIAYEKACIIKPNSHVIISKDNLGLTTILDYAKQLNTSIHLVEDNNIQIIFENNTNYAKINNKQLEFSLLGLWQKQNLALVLKIIEILNSIGFNIHNKALEFALKNVKWNARFQYIKDKNLIIDGAHNPSAASLLKQTLDYYFPNLKRTWVYGSLKTKDYKQVIETLFKADDKIYFYKYSHYQSESFLNLKNASPYDCELITKDKFKNLLNNNYKDKNNLIIVTGSFYMLNELVEEFIT